MTIGRASTAEGPDPPPAALALEPQPGLGRNDAEDDAPSPRHEPLFTPQFALVVVGTASAWLAHTMSLIVLTPFVIGLGFSTFVGGVAMSLIAISALLSRVVAGPRIDHFGGRTPAISGGVLLVAAGLSYLGAAVVPSDSVGLALVILGAAFHGAGFGLMTTSTFTIVGEISPRSRRGEAVGYFGAAQPIIQGIAATLGFAIVAMAGYGVLYGSVTAAALLTVVFFLGLHGRPTELVPSVPISRLPRLAPAVVVPVLACGLLAFVGSSLVLILPLLGQEVSVDNPGFFYLASAVSGVLARLATGRLSDSLGRARVAVPGLVLLSLSLVALLAGTDLGLVAFVVSGAVYGIAVAAALPAIQALILDRSPAGQRGMSSAGMGMALDVGFASGSIAIGLLVGIAGPEIGLLMAAAAPFVSIVLIALDRRRDQEAVA